MGGNPSLRRPRGRLVSAAGNTGKTDMSIRMAALVVLALVSVGCGGGGGGDGGGGATTPPPAGTTPPPPVRDIPATDAEAARFLAQATFGPTRADITKLRQIGYRAWIDEQLDPARAPVTLVTPHILSIPVAELNYAERRNYWLWKSVTAPDQLRMRMAFALSEILVVSDRDYNTANFGRISDYQDTLARGAFGRYRDLLEQVTLHPAMATYLTYMANRKAVSYNNPQGVRVTVVPDENYARELMQLFSIGLVKRNPDFSVITDASGQPVPTYDQAVVTGMARVLTGWTWHGNTRDNFWRWGADNESRPLSCVPDMHDAEPKTIFDGIVIDQGSDCRASLAKMLDALSAHPNVAPFISRQLIQRFVTSNPSPAYIGRVSHAWTQGGGNLGQVLRAILLDPEARDAPAANNTYYGKAREPLLQLTALWRAFDARYVPRANGQYHFGFSNSWDFTTSLEQDSLRSPSVFNFFEPDYRLPAINGSQGFYAPELQLYNEASFTSIFNQLDAAGWSNFRTDVPTAHTNAPVLDINPLRTLAQQGTHTAMVDEVEVLLFAGGMSAGTRGVLVKMLDDLAAAGQSPDDRVRALVQLAVSSPEFVIQR